MDEKRLQLLRLGWTEEMVSQFLKDDLESDTIDAFQEEQTIEGTELTINYDSINASTTIVFKTL